MSAALEDMPGQPRRGPACRAGRIFAMNVEASLPGILKQGADHLGKGLDHDGA